MCRPSGQFCVYRTALFISVNLYEVKDMDIYQKLDAAAYLSGNEVPRPGACCWA